MNSNNNDSNAQQHQVTRGGAGGGLPRLMQGNLQVFLSVEVLLAKVSGRAERQGSVSPPLPPDFEAPPKDRRDAMH